MKPLYSIPLYKYQSIYQLSKINSKIYGFDYNQQSFIEIDIKHSIIYPYQTHSLKQTGDLLKVSFCDNYRSPSYYSNSGSTSQNNPINTTGYSGYLAVYEKSIQRYNFLSNHIIIGNYNDQQNIVKRKQTIINSNSLSSFTSSIDCFQNQLIFVKQHLNHDKYTINWLHSTVNNNMEKDKKILKLLDSKPELLKIIRNSSQILYTDSDNTIKYFSMEKPEQQTILSKRPTIFYDNWTLYTTTKNLVSKFHQKYQIQVLDLKTGKFIFSFQGANMPLKIQTYNNEIFYLTQKCFYIYDKRKHQPIDVIELGEDRKNKDWRSNAGFIDFFLDVNSNKIYLSLTKELRVLEYNFSIAK